MATKYITYKSLQESGSFPFRLDAKLYHLPDNPKVNFLGVNYIYGLENKHKLKFYSAPHVPITCVSCYKLFHEKPDIVFI